MNNLTSLRRLLEQATTERTSELQAVLSSASAHVVYESRELASSVLGILRIQDKTATDAGKNTVGTKNLIGNLERTDPETFLLKVHLRSDDWAGYCVLPSEGASLLGYAFVQRMKGPVWQTPPNWDGSKEMLEEFNRGAGE